ncbi:MAG: alpha/beta hydrolase-fold protein [Deltaproteobacteria bacterium]
MMQLPLRQRRFPRAVSADWIGLLLVLWACGEAQESTSTPGAPVEAVAEQYPATPSSVADETGSGAPASATPGASPSEGIGEPIELAPDEPARPAPDEPARPASDEPGAVTMAPGQSIPPIGQPGFAVGSAPRLVPMAFSGPITGQPVLFNIYLPPGYDSGTASYPVLYDLHGLTDSRDTNPGPVIGSLEAAMRSQVIGPLIVVFPQSFPEGYWADSRDSARPGETQMIRELLPYVDGNFRTLAHRARRGVSGFSMGGFGALAYAVKYPERFSVGIGYDSALDTWETLLGRRANIAAAAFGNDPSYFDQISPWANATRNAAVLTESSRLRGVTGAQYRDFNAAFRDHLVSLGIPYDYLETDCEHNYGCPIGRAGQASWALLQAQFSQAATASAGP